MQYRKLGKTGYTVSEVSLGTWQAGGTWGAPFDEDLAIRTIEKAIDGGVNFIDTADVYSDGKSEAASGKVLRSHGSAIRVATKCGRRLNPHVASGYTPEKMREFVEASLRNMGIETLDLIQLHCPPTEVYYRPEIFEAFDRMKDEGKIRFLGVSVEKVEEGLKAIEYPNVASVQIIFNMFRHRPAELFFKRASEKNVGIIVRVPLASGLLSGKFTRSTPFAKNDHRAFNREGKSFDKGETFSGVKYETGLEAVEDLKRLFPDPENLPLYALRWVLMFPEVSCVIPGASRPEQAEKNIAASGMRPLTPEQMDGVRRVYDAMIRNPVHDLW